MKKVYYLGTCDTCARIIKELKLKEKKFDFQDIKTEKITKEQLEEMKEMAGFEEDERIEREIATFGVDHAQVGQWVLESCGVPRTLSATVQTHHDATRTNTPAALLLHVANTIARADDPFKVAALNTIGTERLYMLSLSRHDLFRIHTSLDSALEQRLTPVF